MINRPRKVVVAMSGGVDSSVAAALLVHSGYDVVGVTLKLWGGVSDSGCCSVSDVEDARRVAEQIGIRHFVFNMVDSFDEKVVDYYVKAHVEGLTPNPCIECNRHLKFGELLNRVDRLGYDLLATGHHARIAALEDGNWLARGVDPFKDQSYVLSMLTKSQLARLLFPIGEMTKTRVREIAAELGLRSATKPDSLDVCFISSKTSREKFLAERVPITSARIERYGTGEDLGMVDSIETVTIGQRRGINAGGTALRNYVVEKDHQAHKVFVGTEKDLEVKQIELRDFTFRDAAPEASETILIQTSAHAKTREARLENNILWLDEPIRRVAPGQSVALYRGDLVVGSAVVAR